MHFDRALEFLLEDAAYSVDDIQAAIQLAAEEADVLIERSYVHIDDRPVHVDDVPVDVYGWLGVLDGYVWVSCGCRCLVFAAKHVKTYRMCQRKVQSPPARLP